jgi:hypothetical protein
LPRALAVWNTSRTASGLHRSMSATVNTTRHTVAGETPALRRDERGGFRSQESGLRYQARPGCRVVTSWTSHALPSGSVKAKNDP